MRPVCRYAVREAKKIAPAHVNPITDGDGDDLCVSADAVG